MTPSFGFGDRIGLATPGHATAMATHGRSLAPIFAQQSIREMIRTERKPADVMADATWGAFRAGWKDRVGADADHIEATLSNGVLRVVLPKSPEARPKKIAVKTA